MLTLVIPKVVEAKQDVVKVKAKEATGGKKERLRVKLILSFTL